MFEVKDNFLPTEEFTHIKNLIMSHQFPWFYNDYISGKEDPPSFYYFTHTLYSEPGRISDWFYLFNNFLKKIECKSIMRMKANLHLQQNIKRKNKPHTDFNFSHKACLFYLNSNNGATYFGKKSVLPKENRAVFFDPSIKHNSSECTDAKRRVNININYF